MVIDFAILAVGVLLAVFIFFILKDLVKVVINSILGLLILYLTNIFHVMGYLGKPDVPLDLVTVLFCILGGVPGALLVMILHLLGVGSF
jgi:inhibitor of the pro-sigma K processing machinery